MILILNLILASVIVSATLAQVEPSNRSPPECGRIPDFVENIPWNVAIYAKKTKIMQICGGTLISNKLVISAGHCFWDFTKKSAANPENYAVAVGKRYRPWNNTMDQHVQTSDISEIKLDPHFQGALTNFQSDIAVLVLTKPVEFNTYVSPACLDFDSAFEKKQLQPGNKGKVTGWGRTPEATVLDAPLLSIMQCFEDAPASFRPLITSDKICLGDKNGTGIVRGFGGAGVTFAHSEGGVTRNYLRGVIISTVPATEEQTKTKNRSSIVVSVTQLSKYQELIKENLL